MTRNGHGKKDSLQRGRKAGGRGRNRTPTCRHPAAKKARSK